MLVGLLGTESLALFNLIKELLLNTAWPYGYCGSSTPWGRETQAVAAICGSGFGKKSAVSGSDFQAE